VVQFSGPTIRINLKAELEVAHLHKKMDRFWEELQAHLARSKRPG